MNNLRFFMSGGPDAGKTMLLDALHEMGCRIFPESARSVIKERIGEGLPPMPSLQQFAWALLERDL
jgi:predicted ATPase